MFVCIDKITAVRMYDLVQGFWQEHIEKTEAELTRLIAILENTSDMVSTATPNAQLTYINTAGRRLLGWSDDEIMDVTDYLNTIYYHFSAADRKDFAEND